MHKRWKEGDQVEGSQSLEREKNRDEGGERSDGSSNDDDNSWVAR